MKPIVRSLSRRMIGGTAILRKTPVLERCARSTLRSERTHLRGRCCMGTRSLLVRRKRHAPAGSAGKSLMGSDSIAGKRGLLLSHFRLLSADARAHSARQVLPYEVGEGCHRNSWRYGYLAAGKKGMAARAGIRPEPAWPPFHNAVNPLHSFTDPSGFGTLDYPLADSMNDPVHTSDDWGRGHACDHHRVQGYSEIHCSLGQIHDDTEAVIAYGQQRQALDGLL